MRFIAFSTHVLAHRNHHEGTASSYFAGQNRAFRGQFELILGGPPRARMVVWPRSWRAAVIRGRLLLYGRECPSGALLAQRPHHLRFLACRWQVAAATERISVTLVTQIPGRKAWMPRSCRSMCMVAASTSYEGTPVRYHQSLKSTGDAAAPGATSDASR